MDEDTLLACVLDERMDERLLLVDGTLMEEDVDDALHGAVTVTVTVFCGQSLHLSLGTAAASPNREARTNFEYILPRE